MSETTMPVAEAQEVAAHTEDERSSYECAFHILPTVAEGEVPGVAAEIRALITEAEGEIIDEEAPERIDLEYEIVKHVEGVNRKFGSAYFGWVRFKLDAGAIEAVQEELAGHKSILRHLLIKLTREEETHPYRYHEHHKKPQTQVVDEGMDRGADQDADTKSDTEKVVAQKTTEESGAVSDKALDTSLDKITKE